MSDIITVAKLATKLATGFGTGKILNSIARNNVPINTTLDQVAVTVSTFVIGQMVTEKAAEYTDAKLDALAIWYSENMQKKS